MNPETKTQPQADLPQARPTNGIPEATTRLPRPQGAGKRHRAWLVGGVAVAAAVVAVVLWRTGVLFARSPYTGPTWTVKREKLKLTIVARGNLEALENENVFCTVRSGTKGSTSSTIIKWIIDEGTKVKKGDKLMELDSSGFQDQLKDKTKDVDKAYADKVTADEAVKIQEITNESTIAAAKNAYDLAKIELEKYREGDYIAALKDIEGKIETTKSDLADWEDRAAWSARMTKKGLMSKVQADADRSRADASKITLQNYEVQRTVLKQYTLKRELQDRKAKVDEAERAMRKAAIEARSGLAQKVANQKTAASIYQQELARKHEIEKEIEKCTVRANGEGLVVYFVPEQVRGGGGSQTSVVAQGEPVREGQKMIQIPNLKKMLATVRVPEAFVAHLHSADKKNRDSWQKAQIRVDSFSKQTLGGHVLAVDTVASQMDFFSSDVKVYKTKVRIDKPADLDLRPGMSAEVTIFADETPEPVLVAPVQAVLGSISTGAQRKCFVLNSGGQPELRDITVGMSNERLVEVSSGLKEGDQIVLNPQSLLKDDSELKAGKPRTHSKNGQGPGRGEGGGPAGAVPAGGPAGSGAPGGPKGGPRGGSKGPAGFKGGPGGKPYGGAPGAP
jgi:multidrug efflux pump subunit AcrA (membrane-fusion protein)